MVCLDFERSRMTPLHATCEDSLTTFPIVFLDYLNKQPKHNRKEKMREKKKKKKHKNSTK